MVADCFDEPKVFSSFSRAKESLESTAEYYKRSGWSGEWEDIPKSDIESPIVSFAKKAYRCDGDGRYVFYVVKSKVNYFD